ncbi:hypothetical protein [Sorangium sp. So ce1151]|uniref:hypothetical protein n=1 Tax=Sorangium sp. So ce1151 TaxID=3133332 RepID=UPI003F6178FB
MKLRWSVPADMVTKAFIVVLTMTVVSGCDPASDPLPERNYPTECYQHVGRYYDPKVGQCVEPATDEEELVLDAYRYIYQLWEEARLNEAKFDIYFNRHMTIDQSERLWAALESQGATMINVAGTLTEDELRELEGNAERADICGWTKRDGAVAESTITEMIANGMSSEDPKLRQSVVKKRLCRVYAIEVISSPAIIIEFWNRYHDYINGIRPRVNSYDLAMPSFAIE